ncbi:MAG: hypothetical protein WCH99_12220 [Verrucomicrobiota bacterium]
MNTSTIMSLGFLLVLAFGCSRETGTPSSKLFGSGDPKAAYRDGRAEAQRDIAGGKIVLKTYGLPAAWSEMYRSNLSSRYQIESRPVAGCVVTEALVESVKGYNEISKAEIERRNGTGILQRVAKESEQMWQQRQTNK